MLVTKRPTKPTDPFIIVGLLVLTACTCASTALALEFPVASGFDAGLEGWTCIESGPLTWQPEGGNLGGFALFEDTDSGTGRILAPGSYYGDWSDLDGAGTLSWYHRIVRYGGIDQILPPMAWISGPGGSAHWTSPVVPGSEWVLVSAPISGPAWVLDSGSWSDLLADVTQLTLQIELVDNSGPQPWDQDGIDGVVLQNPFSSVCSPHESQSPVFKVFPNPTHGTLTIHALSQVGPVSGAAIYDCSGRLVRCLSSPALPRGDGSIHWNGRDDSGRLCASGSYLARVTSHQGATDLRFLLIR